MNIRIYFIAVNTYRSTTDHGFANTWAIYRCLSRYEQHRMLSIGMPVIHCSDPHPTTFGLRPITRAEGQSVLLNFERFGILPDLLLFGTPC